MRFVPTYEKLPEPSLLCDSCGDYYTIKMGRYGVTQAMYAENEDGDRNWYKDYTAMIIVPVTHWLEDEGQ
jgi:hypothetical protein